MYQMIQEFLFVYAFDVLGLTNSWYTELFSRFLEIRFITREKFYINNIGTSE